MKKTSLFVLCTAISLILFSSSGIQTSAKQADGLEHKALSIKTHQVGSQAPLFDSVDENLNPISMADLIDGMPLVFTLCSAS